MMTTHDGHARSEHSATGYAGPVQARRLRIRPLRDPRLFLGLLLVLGSAVLGGKVLTAAQGGQEYWALRSHVRAGDPVLTTDLIPVRVRLSSGIAGQYQRSDVESSFEGSVWLRDIPEGVLLANDSFGNGGPEPIQVPLNVEAGSAPNDLLRGDLVDVWVGPGVNQADDAKTHRVLSAVRVLSAEDGRSFGQAIARTVLVGAPADLIDGAIIRSLAAGHVTLVRVS